MVRGGTNSLSYLRGSERLLVSSSLQKDSLSYLRGSELRVFFVGRGLMSLSYLRGSEQYYLI